MDRLKRYLAKVGVKSYQDLNEEEKATYRMWEDSLSGRKITDDDVSVFLATEEDATIQKLIASPQGTRDDTFLKMKLEMIRKIRHFLNSPVVERRIMESNIDGLLSQ